MKKKYYLLGLLVLAIFIIAYHFYAARQAEEQIGEAIREQAEQPASPVSVTYSSIDISPFNGDIYLNDLSVVDSSGILRSRSVHLDMNYNDFLNIYLWGLQYGLERLTSAQLSVEQPSFVNRSSFMEIKLHSVNVTFKGNAWNTLVSLVNSVPAEEPQSLRVDGDSLTYHMPSALPGTIRADVFTSKHSFPAESKAWWRKGEHQLKLNGVRWTPPTSFQEQYGFFIRGFGYETDQIPADSLLLSYNAPSASPASISASLFTDLFDAQANSQLFINPNSFIGSRLKDGVIDIKNTSEQFDIFTQNLEQLFGIKLANPPGQVLRFSGPLNNPRFSLQR